MKYLFLSICLFILIIQTICNLVVIPFINKEIPGEDNDKYIYTQIEIGDPPKKIDSIINFQDSYFYISNITNYNINLNSSYNSSLTSSFNIISNSNISGFNKIISEKLYFYNDINYENKNEYNISPILYNDINPNESLFNIIGMQINCNINRSFNIINILKNLNIINNFYWTIKLDNLTQGKLIIGDLPEKYDKNYENKNLTFINTYSKENNTFWGFQFTSIKIDNITIKTNLTVGKIEPKILEIFGSYEYIKEIEEKFFEKYENKSICRRILDKLIGKEIFRFVCDKSLFNKSDINLFPNLTLINIELNYSFILTGEELFIEKNNNIYFMIVSKVENNSREWELGRIFLYKYNLVMENDNYLIGIYKEKIDNKESKKNFSTVLIIVISILLLNILLALTVLIYYLRNNVCKNRKKISLESDDYLIYFPDINE